MLPINNCPSCGQHELEEFLLCNDYSVSRESFTLKKCVNCELVITTPQPEANKLERYYQSDEYISHTNKGTNLINKLYLLARSFTSKQKLKLINRYNKSGKILDVGCGTGSFLKVCKQYGWVTHGMEPSPRARHLASVEVDHIYTSLDSITVTNYDIITLWHVLEHISNINEALQLLYEKLAQRGTIFIAVPNYQSYDAQHYKNYWAGYDVPRHLWHFSQKAMRSLLQKNNFNLVDIKPMRLDSFYVSLLSEKYKRDNVLNINGFTQAITVGLSSNIKANNNNYSSLIYIAQK